MARIKKEPKQTHYNMRTRRADGSMSAKMEKIVQRAPLRVKSYSIAERFTIVELMIFNLVDRGIVYRQDIAHLVHAHLVLQKCEVLRDVSATGAHTLQSMAIDQIAGQLIELELLEPADKRKWRRSQLHITPKGKRHVKKQCRRLRKCAQKLVFTDILEKLALVVS